MIGQRVNQYRITRQLGAGGMGIVYQAEDTRLQRTVALKFLPANLSADPEARQRLEQEARAAAGLQHPGICTVHEIGEMDGQIYIVMACCEGMTLRQRFADGPLAIDETLQLGIRMAEALTHAHTSGVVHRDIKPGNVMLAPDGRPVVMDFGLARMADRSRLTMTGTTLGTPRYMAPEQAQGGEVDQRTDIWALGVLLYEALAGQTPFAADFEQAVIYGILHEGPPPLTELRREVPFALERIVDKCLAKDPAKRYQTVAELAADLRALRDELRAGTRTERFKSLRRLRRRRRLLAGMAAVIAVLVLFAGYRFITLRGRTIDAIAVLPFLDVSQAQAQDFFADGLTDDLITELQRLCGHDVRVISRTSVMCYRNTDLSLSKIAEELGVDALVEASVHRSGDEVRITAKLIRVGPEQQLWAQSFQRDARDILALHGDIARTVAEQVQVTLSPEQIQRVEQARSVDPEAYKAYLMGRHWFHQGTAIGVKRSVPYFERAVALDPQFVGALAGLADAIITHGCFGINHPIDVYPRARKLIHEALELDPTNAEALTALGHMTWEFDWDFEESERLLRQAIDLNPSYAFARHVLGWSLMIVGRQEEGRREIEYGYELDPQSPNLAADLANLCRITGDGERSWQLLQSTAQRFPDWDPAYDLASHHWWVGDHAKAIELIEGAPLDYGMSGRIITLCRLNAAAGDTVKAREYLAAVLSLADSVYVQPGRIAGCFRALGDTENELFWYEEALKIHDPWMSRMRGLLQREDPRFVAVAQRVGFE